MTGERPPCPAYDDGKHQAGEDFREWRVAKAQGKPIACRCGLDVWPACSTCGEPEVGWQRHALCHNDRGWA